MKHALLIGLIAVVAIAGCENSVEPLTDPPVTLTIGDRIRPTTGGDPDGVGLEVLRDTIRAVYLETWEYVPPESLMPDPTPVIVIYHSDRVNKTTWGGIKEEYAG